MVIIYNIYINYYFIKYVEKKSHFFELDPSIPDTAALARGISGAVNAYIGINNNQNVIMPIIIRHYDVVPQ